MGRDLLVFETHPIQYRAPVYQELARLLPGGIEVIYASDCSVRGHYDRGFSKIIAWDNPLLEGYPYRILANERGVPLTSWGSLTGRGVYRLMKEVRPRAVLMNSFRYLYDWETYLAACWLRIPVWIRVETQDSAFVRSRVKDAARFIIYRILYAGVTKAFYIGALNRDHLLRHGLNQEQLAPGLYCAPNTLEGIPTEAKLRRRISARARLGLPSDKIAVAFFGKLIPKKNPQLLLEAIQLLPQDISDRVVVMFVGAGQLERELRVISAASKRRQCHSTVFAGFVNQSVLADYYLASDLVVLPSQRMGETWGLVVNEALQAGCGVIVSDAVGCHRDFSSWERVRVIAQGDSRALADAIRELATFPRNFDWAGQALENYSVRATANSIASELNKLARPPAI